MSKAPATLDARLGSPFEPYLAMHRALRWWQAVAAGLVLIVAAAVVVIGFLCVRPPVVIVKDRVHGEPATLSVATSAPKVTVADARAFFVAMARLRWGWDSLTVARDMHAFRQHCYRDQRAREETFLDELVGVDAAAPDKKMPRLAWWQQQGVANHLVLPDTLDAIECIEKDEVFHCHMRATLVTQHMFPAPDERPMRHPMVLLATFLRVPHRIQTPYGLVVGMLGEGPDTAKEQG